MMNLYDELNNWFENVHTKKNPNFENGFTVTEWLGMVKINFDGPSSCLICQWNTAWKVMIVSPKQRLVVVTLLFELLFDPWPRCFLESNHFGDLLLFYTIYNNSLCLYCIITSNIEHKSFGSQTFGQQFCSNQ